MNKLIRLLSADKILYQSTLAGLFLFIITFLIALISYFFLPPVIPLFNQMPWGEARLGIREVIFIPSAIAGIVFFLNTSAALSFYSKMPLISRISTVTAIFIALFAFLLTIRTVILVI